MSRSREDFNTDHLEVAVSQTDQDLETAAGKGKKGNLLERLVVTVATSLTGNVEIKDGGGSAIPITAINTPIGVYSVEIGARSNTGVWSVTTGAGATVMAIGDFTSQGAG